MLRTATEIPVVDRTGLAGKYDFTLEFAKDPAIAGAGVPEAPLAPSLNTALQQQLGLQLNKQKVPFDVVVIDSVELLPTAN
jgi:uncharacterized protein (TIGR03435 family)